ncbi:MAG: peroxisomal assembly protein [Sclerophora amabilis]|nr:MAG: peroxisomal assembly protein [Sclerophora amabilis]
MDQPFRTDSRKRRRRRPNKPSISAKLVLERHLKDDVGLISSDLLADLFPATNSTDGSHLSRVDSSRSSIQYVAIAPWTPISALPSQEICWTIIPVRPLSDNEAGTRDMAHSTIYFSASSWALQSFAQSLPTIVPPRSAHKGQAALDIRVLDVIPLGLDTIFVAVTDELIKSLKMNSRNGQVGFGHGSRNGSTMKKRESAKGTAVRMNTGSEHDPDTARNWSLSDEHQFCGAVRKALESPKIVHSGDSLVLPLPSHPITHLPPPPVKVISCEPVAQGLLLPVTRIIATRAQDRHTRRPPNTHVQRLLTVAPEEDEDTSDDRFYSAAEEGGNGLASSSPNSEQNEDFAVAPSESDVSGADTEDASDDSLDDMISLHAPQLPPETPSIISAFQPGTPYGRGASHGTAGVATPGSVFSNYTATTARPGEPSGRLFAARGILDRIPDEALYPKPNSDHDDEARLFVPVGALAKIGCFSGDWVRIETAAEPPANSLGSWGLGAFEHAEQQPECWRIAKIYGFPESYKIKTLGFPHIKPKDHSNLSGPHFRKSTLAVYLSPILLANLHEPSHVRIAPISPKSHSSTRHMSPGAATLKRDAITSSSMPPTAKEVTLMKISTPSSTERALQGPLLAGLRRFFEGKRRLVQCGDLIGVTIDEGLGKLLFQGSNQADDDSIGDDLIPNLSNQQTCDSFTGAQPRKIGVAWFKVGQVVSSHPRSSVDMGEDVWGGMAIIDPTSTRMVQAGSHKVKLPGVLENTWQYYMGLRSAPRSDLSISHQNELMLKPLPYVSPLQRRLEELIAAATSPRAAHLGMQPLAILLVSTQRNIGKATVARRACDDLGIHTFIIDAFDVLTEGGTTGGDVKSEALLKARTERALSCGPEFCALLIRHIEALTAERIGAALAEIIGDSRVLIATTTDLEKIPDSVRGLFTHELDMTAPDEGAREGLLRDILDEGRLDVAGDVDLAAVAVRTAALVAGDLVDVVERGSLARQDRLERLVKDASQQENSSGLTVRDVEVAGGEASRCLTKADFDIAIDAARKNFADAIGAPKIPNVGWDDVGGLTNVKDAVMETIQLPLERPELFTKGMKKRSGILFYGPPGTGKTLLAKAIATEFSLNFFSVKGPELLNMYIGESEANVRRVFQRARDARPCVVFFDELDSVAPKRGNQGDSGGVMDRIVSQLLAELDGMSNGEDGGGGVFVIGATNRPDLLDAALLRPGRFDKMLYLGISDTHEKQLTILQALTRRFNAHPSLSLRRVAEALPFTYTGADLYALCSDAMLKAVTRKADAVDRKIKALSGKAVSPAYFFDHLATKEDTAVMVEEEDFMAAQRELVGSVSAKELEHYARVRKTFEDIDPQDERYPPSLSKSSNTIPVVPKNIDQHGHRSKGKKKGSIGTGKGKIASSEIPSRNKPEDGDHGYDRFYEPDDDGNDGADDNVIHTDHLVVNGNGAVNGNGHAHSKAKGKAAVFEDPSHNDEEQLYG